MSRDSTESRFREVLAQFGGPERVLLVSELWDRAESRALLDGFLREVFPSEYKDGGRIPPGEGPQEPDVQSKGSASKANGAQGSACPSKRLRSAPDRTLRSPLVFFLCRSESLRLREQQLHLREILRDVRKRSRCGGAVIGVIMQTSDPGSTGDTDVPAAVIREDSKAGGPGAALPDDAASLLFLLRSVFPPEARGGSSQWVEVRATTLIPGQEDTRRDVQRLACEALAAADVQKPEVVFSQCFPWRRRRKDSAVTADPEEGTALPILRHHNGACSDGATDA